MILRKIFFIFLLLLSLCTQAQLQDLQAQGVGENAIFFEAKTILNKNINLDSLKGQVVVLNFWFTACSPCIKEIYLLNKVAEKHKDKVHFLAISFDKNDAYLARVVRIREMQYQIIADREDICKAYKIKMYPTNIIIDKKGKMIFAEIGFKEDIEEKLNKAIETALKD